MQHACYLDCMHVERNLHVTKCRSPVAHGLVLVVSTDTCMYPSCYMKHVMSACYLLVGSPYMHV